jgi:hypothetical protein
MPVFPAAPGLLPPRAAALRAAMTVTNVTTAASRAAERRPSRREPGAGCGFIGTELPRRDAIMRSGPAITAKVPP